MAVIGTGMSAFDPRRPVARGAYYVERPDTAWRRLGALLEAEAPSCLLFSGARGAGKTSELLQLEPFLKGAGFVSIFPLLHREVEPSGASAVDVLAIAALHVARNLVYAPFQKSCLTRAEDRGKSFPDLTRQSVAFAESIGRRLDPDRLVPRRPDSFWRTNRRTLFTAGQREQLDSSAILDFLDLAADSVVDALDKPLVILMDGLDRAPPDHVERLLVDEGPLLTASRASVVYTVPLAALHSSRANLYWETFDAGVVHPNFRLRDHSGREAADGIDAMRKVVRTRLAKVEGLSIDDRALHQAVLLSGGVTRELLRIIQFALSRSDDQRIEQSHVAAAVADLTTGIQRSVGLDQYDRLAEIHRRKQLVSLPEDRELIHNLLVLEYSNGDRWVDVHPALWPLIEQEADLAEQEG